jgi:predicted amidohydrolase YtcJ
MTPGPVAFVGGRILSMDQRAPTPQAVVVTGDHIAAVGDRSVLDAHPAAHVVDLTGQTLLPGFIDAHNHLSLAAMHPRWADVAPAQDVASLGRVLARQAAQDPGSTWVRGSGWELHSPLALTRHDLDALGLERPVVVAHFSFHQCVVSSLGLDLLGITRGIPDPPGGAIDRDSGGTPTGVLRERAWGPAHAASVADFDPEHLDALILARMRTLLAEGITAVHDAACSPAIEAAYRRLRRADLMELSVLALPHPVELFRGPGRARLDGPPTGEGDAWLRVGPVKLFADGGSHPAVDAHAGGRRVVEGYAFPDLVDDARRATDRGFALATHAMGNAGLRSTLAAYRDVRARRPDDDLRPRVEHATLAGPPEVRALADLGAVAVVQPGFVDTIGRRVGQLRFDDASWMPFADLVDRGVVLAASSDHPSAPASPLSTSRLATAAGAPDDLPPDSHQALPLEEWLRAWTVGAAFAGGQEHERGSLTPGKRADLVVLDGLPEDPATEVVQTWVSGAMRYHREDPATPGGEPSSA